MTFDVKTTSKHLALFGLVSLTALQGCWKKTDADSPGVHTIFVEKETPGIKIPSGNLPTPSADDSAIEFMGGIITTRVIAGRVYIPVHAALSENSFSSLQEHASLHYSSEGQRNSFISEALSKDISAVQKHLSLLDVQQVAEFGYFSAFIALDDYPRLSSVTGLSQSILLNPIIQDTHIPRSDTIGSTQGVTLGARSSGARSNNDSYSGLGRIGVKEFLAQTKAEIGEDVDGSKVRVGVTDTGITLNHPAFFDSNGKNRISYMKDFTGEGQIYFSNSAPFEAREPLDTEVPAGANKAEIIVITAKYLLTPVGIALPVADKLSDVTNQVFQVNADLKSQLLTPGSGAKLGVFSEASLANTAAKEFVDLNHNGKNDDLLWALLLPHSELPQSKVFIDLKGTGDFRKSPALSDWNTSKTTITSFSETFGLHFKNVELTNTDGSAVKAIAAAVVGYDPGNHGSHVAGIIGARKTISNDADGTNARGVAPNTDIMLNRVCANNGGCNATNAFIDLATNGAEVINMSLGGLNPWNDGYGVQETMVNRMSQLKNVLFIISAGNSGPGRQTVGSPSVALRALSVAATATPDLVARQYQYPGSGKVRSSDEREKDFVLFFSSRGPTAAGGFKPNISAPGTELSAVQLNAAAGQRSGLDVYWGTSMAAPTAAGAAALLIDAAKRYNAKYPNEPLPIDSATLHRVLTASARPFDVNMFVPKTGKRLRGQYTWIDQGHGMIHLPSAWKALKMERDKRLASAVFTVDSNGRRSSVPLDYEVRVLRVSPNGNDYTGVVMTPTPELGAEPRFGRGIFLDHKSTESFVGVQITRRLPLTAQRREDAGELNRQLVTTADTFSLETVIYGSSLNWIKAGTLGQLDCSLSPIANLTVIGHGPTEAPDANAPDFRSKAFAVSNLNVCLDRELMKSLQPGDHGAIIKAFRTVDGQREPHPSFEVPVYVSVPHGTIAGRAGYKEEGTVRSFGVERHYVAVPEGVSVLKISLEVPEAQVNGTTVKGCAGVELMVLEGLNTAIPAELKPRTKAQISNCDKLSGAVSDKRIVSYHRANPKAGIWDVHVFGSYNFAESQYKLSVDFASVDSSLTEVTGTTDALQGSFEFKVLESSIAVSPSAKSSTYQLSNLVQRQTPLIGNQQTLRVPTVEGSAARTYEADVTSVAFETGGLPGSDLDLAILECSDDTFSNCKTVVDSTGQTDVERAVFTPTKGKFYIPEVLAYQTHSSVPLKFEFAEKRSFQKVESGRLAISTLAEDEFKVEFDFDISASTLLAYPLFTSGLWSASGDIHVKSEDGGPLLRIPVEVTKK